MSSDAGGVSYLPSAPSGLAKQLRPLGMSGCSTSVFTTCHIKSTTFDILTEFNWEFKQQFCGPHRELTSHQKGGKCLFSLYFAHLQFKEGNADIVTGIWFSYEY